MVSQYENVLQLHVHIGAIHHLLLCNTTDPSLIPSSSLSQHNPSSRSSPEPGPSKTSNPLSLPSPHPAHKSVLSIKIPPDSNTSTGNQRRVTTADTKPVASAPVTKWNFGEELSGRNAPNGRGAMWSDENYWKNCDDGNRSPYFWERTFMNQPEEDTKKEQDSNCKTQ